eukprot:CAMPEP_0179057436 /NCGR_PEP_ID=MMETSP0796-20121207/24334_1 /TAXON_ID=73915 /ORGANISM="Pyrodinium bahamense, Strain pbaha01" /LENGTH=47 /DNA_ID= /DNA_START= /DNA_END= /DNA_ORIENTATION=
MKMAWHSKEVQTLSAMEETHQKYLLTVLGTLMGLSTVAVSGNWWVRM